MTEMNIRALLERQAKDLGEKPFLYFKDTQVSFAQVDREANRAANFLTGIGIKSGDTVCVMLPNRPEFIYLWFGLAKLGAIMVPLNVHLKGTGLQYIINHCDAATLIIDASYYEQVEAIRSELTTVKHYFVLGAGSDSVNGFVNYETGLAAFDVMSPAETALAASDTMSILYTSGTTGLPKGVMLSHLAYLTTGKESIDIFQMQSADVFYTCLPLFHVNAQLLTTMGCLTAGIPMALGEKFSVANFWQEISSFGATLSVFIGSMAVMLFKQPQKSGDANNSLRAVACAAMPKDVWQEFEARFALKIIECYGLTETSAVATANPYTNCRVGSIGKPTSFVDVQVWDEANGPVAPNVLGEIVVKGKFPHAIMENYYKMPDKTAEAITAGWFHSGDRGYYDADGYYYFVDRIKDCIRRRGENISTFEMEKTINAHPAVQECAAVGVPSEFGEEDVKLCVVLKEGQAVTPQEIYDFCRERMAYFMVPRYMIFKESLPKTATQRIQKFFLKEEGITGAWDSQK